MGKSADIRSQMTERESRDLSADPDLSNYSSERKNRVSWLRLTGRPGQIIVLLIACYFLFFFRIGARDLWNPDEPRYAQVAREMMETGEWVVPHLNGEVYTEKPPLYFWLIALISKPFGDVSEVTARLPSAMCAALIVLLTYVLGAKMLDRQAAFFGAVFMATSTQFVWIGRVGTLDMLLTLSILAAMAVFYVAYADKRPLLYAAGFAFLIPGIMTKGPVGITVPLVVMLAFLLTEVFLGKVDAKKQLAWFAVSTVVGLAVIALVVVPWWQAAHERSGGAYGSLSILIKQTKGRMIEAYSHKQPFHYYFGEILWQVLPWTVLIPLTAHAVWKKGNLRQNDGLRFLLVWFLGIFLFFTYVSGKRSQYLLPLFPAGGLILGWALTVSNPFEGLLRERKAFWIPLLALKLGVAVGLAALVVAAYSQAPEHLSTTMIVVFSTGVCLLILIRQCLGRAPGYALTGVAVITLITTATFYGYVAPSVIDKHKSARPFCNRVLEALEEDDGLYYYRYYKPNINYYMHRRIPVLQSNEHVLEALEASPRIFLGTQCALKDALDKGAAENGYRIEEFVRTKIGSRDIICVIVRPPETSG